MSQKDKETLRTVPAWVQHFMVHVIKRSLSNCIKWIDDMKEANSSSSIDQPDTIGYNGQRK